MRLANRRAYGTSGIRFTHLGSFLGIFFMHNLSFHIREAEILIWFILGVFVGANLGVLCMATLYFGKGDDPEMPPEPYSPWDRRLH